MPKFPQKIICFCKIEGNRELGTAPHHVGDTFILDGEGFRQRYVKKSGNGSIVIMSTDGFLRWRDYYLEINTPTT